MGFLSIALPYYFEIPDYFANALLIGTFLIIIFFGLPLLMFVIWNGIASVMKSFKISWEITDGWNWGDFGSGIFFGIIFPWGIFIFIKFREYPLPIHCGVIVGIALIVSGIVSLDEPCFDASGIRRGPC